MRVVGFLAAFATLALSTTSALADTSEAGVDVTTARPSTGAGDSSYHVGVELGWGHDGMSISTTTNPFIDCTIVWSLTGEQTLDYAGATGQAQNIVSPDIGLTDDLYHFVSCPHAQPNDFWEVWPETEPPPAVILDALQQAALSRLRLPFEPPQASPPGTYDHPNITQLETWLWTSNWTPLSATASLQELNAPIDLSITVTATPTSTSWDPGDGTPPIACQQGTAWDQGNPDLAPSCSHTYTKRTEGTAITLSVQQTWQPTTTCSPASLCANLDPLPSITTETSRDIHVVSVYPVITG